MSGAPDTGAWRDRYSRQIRFAEFGLSGQTRLSGSSVLLVGVGALGSHLAQAMVGAGVGRLWLIDRDVVEVHNLPRQVLFTEADAASGRPKALAAAEHLRRNNSACDLIGIADEFAADTLDTHAIAPDLILDGTDNFATRYLINDLALQKNIPWIYGAAVGAEGMAMAVLPRRTPCLRCLLPDPPTTNGGTCDTDGILAPAIAMVTAFQTAQALKVLAGRLEQVASGVFTVDVWRNSFALQMQGSTPAAECPACSGQSYPALEATAESTVSLCGRDVVQVRRAPGSRVDLSALASVLRRAEIAVEETPGMLRFAADDCTISVFPSGRALLFGVNDAKRALALYDRFIGGR